MFKWFKKFMIEQRKDAAFNKIQSAYEDMGHPEPVVATLREIHIRAICFEQFKDWATDKILAGDMDIKSLKDRFIKDKLFSGCSLTADEIRWVTEIIRNMPENEMLHPEAYRVWSTHFEAENMESLRSMDTPESKELLAYYEKLTDRVLLG